MIGRASLATAAALLLAAPAAAQVVRTELESFRVVTVVERLEHPWSVAFLPDGRMLVTERAGRLRMVGRDGKLAPQPVAGLPKIEEYGQGGLLDVAPHPRFAENALVYLSFAERGDGGYGTAVLRGRLAGSIENAALENVEVIYRQAPKSRTGRHFGSRLVFDRAGFLYVTQGDRGDQDRAQKLDDLAGKVVRLHDDGRIPQDNPFVGRSGSRPEIFTLGNRNAQGAALHPVTGELWAHEHGPQGGDEVNVLRAGRNYGWPVIGNGRFYLGPRVSVNPYRENMEPPVAYWVPAIAPSGLVFYTGDKFPQWKNNLFVGGMRQGEVPRSGHLERFDFNEKWEELHREGMLRELQQRIRDVRQGPDGYLYLLTAENDGAMMKIEPGAPKP